MSSESTFVPLDRTFTHRLHALSKLTDRVTQSAYESEVGVPMHEGRCLLAVGSFCPMSINDLARYANLDKGQASRAAQALVLKGLVCKEVSNIDGRGVVLSLTEAGKKMWERAMVLIERRNDEILTCLTDTEQKQFSCLLDRLVSHALVQQTAC